MLHEKSERETKEKITWLRKGNIKRETELLAIVVPQSSRAAEYTGCIPAEG